MIAHLSTILHHNCLLDTIKPVIVGVSGGADSLCLLDVLYKGGYKVVVAHLDHMLRPGSSEDARLVERYAASLGVPFVSEQADVAAYARQQGETIESAARMLRYRFLFRQAKDLGAQAVAVGHHADDQVETILMHLLRGAGLQGLRGMDYRTLPNAWSQDIALVRPLLGVWKEEIQAYVNERGYQPAVDESNIDLAFLRNRVRHALIPQLEGLNPQARQAIWRMAEILQGDEAALGTLLEPIWRHCLLEAGGGFVALDLQAISPQPVGVQRRLLRAGLNLLRPGLEEIDLELVERARHFLASPPRSRQADLGNGLRISLEGNRLWLSEWRADLPNDQWPQMVGKEALALNVPGTLLLANDWRLTAERVAKSSQNYRLAAENMDPYQAWFDGESLPASLLVRGRRLGERMSPLGMGGHTLKLSDLMINLKVPLRARSAWPLVLSQEEVIWAPGLRQAQAHQVREGSAWFVVLRLKKGEDVG